MRTFLKAKVTGQDAQIEEIVSAFQAFALGIQQKNVPIMSYLLAGPTGVGKTETVRALAEYIFGGSKAVLKINGANYQDPAPGDIHRLQQIIVKHIRKYGFNIIHFDEIEKMDKNATKLLLALLDGDAVDAYGNKFTSGMSMVFATSNLGMGEIIHSSYERMEAGAPALTTVERNNSHWTAIVQHFQATPELIKRFDGRLYFNPLRGEAFIPVVETYLRDHITKEMQRRHVTLIYDSSLINVMATEFSDEMFGARGTTKDIKREFTNKFLAGAIMKDEIKSGHRYRVRAVAREGRPPLFSVELEPELKPQK